MTHYDTLGVPRDAPPARIRSAYLTLVRQLHPDSLVGRPSAEIAKAGVRFRAVTEAWEVLGNTDARRSYDRSLAVRASSDTARASSARPMHAPAGHTTRPDPPSAADDDVDVMPSGCLPLGFVLGGIAVLVVLAVALLAIGFAQSPTGNRPNPPRVSDTNLAVQVGDCVLPTRSTEPVSCATAKSLEVIAVARVPARCNERLATIRYDDRYALCVEPI
jgi:hypothetical protein